MKSFLRVLLLLLTTSVWSQLFPSVPAEGSDFSSQNGLSESSSPDRQGLPAKRDAPGIRRMLADAAARSDDTPQKQITFCGSGTSTAQSAPPSCSSLIQGCVSRVAHPFQPHLRTNGSADAHGSRA